MTAPTVIHHFPFLTHTFLTLGDLTTSSYKAGGPRTAGSEVKMDLYLDNIDQLLRARSEIDEELRRHKTQIAVFFTDVVGSTTYFDRFGDTAGLLLLHRHDNLVTTAVTEFHGVVVKTIGDSVMAEFPNPVLAVRAAVAIQQRLFDQNKRAVENERLRIRTGIHYGIGFRRGNDLFGDVINLAARITKHGGPGQILISSAVREALLDTEICCGSIGKVPLEGRTETEELHEVIWESVAREEYSPSNIIRASELGDGEDEAPDLARYEILARVGAGGMGRVFKARDRETGEIVALKILRPEIADQPPLIEAFKNELRLARKITHKNVCRIYDFNRASGFSFISMEFVEGESLRRVLNRFNALSTRTGIKIAMQICDGLREAHAQGIVHRDLKPENLMIDASGNVKLMDFGLACLAADGSTSAVGTPSYMAPEQAQGGPLDRRCDIYALGLVLFEIFTGHATFTGDTPMAVALKQIQDAPANPSQLEHTIPDHIAKTILRCLEKDPAKRFQWVEELQAALSDPTASRKTTSQGRRKPMWTPAGWITLAGVLILATVIMFSPGSTALRGIASPSGAEFAAFHMAESLGTREAWNTFLKNYRKGDLAAVARDRIKLLNAIEQEERLMNATQPKTVPANANTKPADANPRPKWSPLTGTVIVPGDVFMMGNNDGKGDEKPKHQVRVDGFRISESQITNREYSLFLEDTGRQRPRDPAFAKNYLAAYPDLPVVNVSYEDATAFCNWASKKFGLAVRLPTEAEWEYAAQGRIKVNSWDWVSDFYSKDYYAVSPIKNPVGPATGSKRVIRTERRRGSRDPKEASDQIGFRIVVR
jgi:serine/threonine protein kinase/class 3 adenylate cyclase